MGDASKLNTAFTKLIETNTKMCPELFSLRHISLVAFLLLRSDYNVILIFNY